MLVLLMLLVWEDPKGSAMSSCDVHFLWGLNWLEENSSRLFGCFLCAYWLSKDLLLLSSGKE